MEKVHLDKLDLGIHYIKNKACESVNWKWNNDQVFDSRHIKKENYTFKHEHNHILIPVFWQPIR